MISFSLLWPKIKRHRAARNRLFDMRVAAGAAHFAARVGSACFLPLRRHLGPDRLR